MRTTKVELKKPIWNGGKPCIGVAQFRLNSVDRVEVEIMYTRKDGTRSYPDIYVMDVAKLVTYPTQVVGNNVKLYVAPLSDWEVKDGRN